MNDNTHPSTTERPGPAAPSAETPPGVGIAHSVAHVCGVFGAALALYGTAGIALVQLDRAVLHQPGDYGSIYLPGCGGSLVIGLILAVGAVVVGRSFGLSWRPKPGWHLFPLACGAVALGYGLLTSVGAVWYDIHYVENGVIGASFAGLGVWLAWFFLFPVGSLLVALGLGRR